MSEADGFIVQLVITFIRNLLKIPDRAATAGRRRRTSVSFPNSYLSCLGLPQQVGNRQQASGTLHIMDGPPEVLALLCCSTAGRQSHTNQSASRQDYGSICRNLLRDVLAL